ncbi:MAG: Hpt domain-containing protein [Oscillospiraceae bacterium]|nr:Hpt domain-containing protein [Oscillospiraceae bacterium]
MENIVIPGVDVEGALRRLRGNTKLYAKLLGQFLGGSDLAELRDAIDGGDAKAAAKAAHTIKGVAANLSAVDIQNRVIELEASLKEAEGITEEHRAILEDIARLYDEARVGCAPLLNQ